MRSQAVVGPEGRLRIPSNARILVCDGERALFLENRGTALEPSFARTTSVHHENPPNRDQVSDRPGRFNDGPHAQRSSMGEADWHEQEKRRFAHRLADMLHEELQGQLWDAVVLVAPAPVLGELRSHLHPEVASRVIAEIDKTLTKHPIDEIQKLVVSAKP